MAKRILGLNPTLFSFSSINLDSSYRWSFLLPSTLPSQPTLRKPKNPLKHYFRLIMFIGLMVSFQTNRIIISDQVKKSNMQPRLEEEVYKDGHNPAIIQLIDVPST